MSELHTAKKVEKLLLWRKRLEDIKSEVSEALYFSEICQKINHVTKSINEEIKNVLLQALAAGDIEFLKPVKDNINGSE